MKMVMAIAIFDGNDGDARWYHDGDGDGNDEYDEDDDDDGDDDDDDDVDGDGDGDDDDDDDGDGDDEMVTAPQIISGTPPSTRSSRCRDGW